MCDFIFLNLNFGVGGCVWTLFFVFLFFAIPTILPFQVGHLGVKFFIFLFLKNSPREFSQKNRIHEISTINIGSFFDNFLDFEPQI